MERRREHSHLASFNDQNCRERSRESSLPKTRREPSNLGKGEKMAGKRGKALRPRRLGPWANGTSERKRWSRVNKEKAKEIVAGVRFL